MKKLALVAFLAMPGSFVLLALLCMHPRLRAEISDVAGFEAILSRLNRQAILLLLVLSLHLNQGTAERAN
ncbi:hypothetical protein [Ralstonia pseudosolanacearum]|uniref:hypothetical protein n=1 Tax=Ralstonia pseudosolanacearum TaxID=1310165 RepID=UPI003CE7BF9D